MNVPRPCRAGRSNFLGTQLSPILDLQTFSQHLASLLSSPSAPLVNGRAGSSGFVLFCRLHTPGLLCPGRLFCPRCALRQGAPSEAACSCRRHLRGAVWPAPGPLAAGPASVRTAWPSACYLCLGPACQVRAASPLVAALQQQLLSVSRCSSSSAKTALGRSSSSVDISADGLRSGPPTAVKRKDPVVGQ